MQIWLRTAVLAAVSEWVLGDAEVCEHQPDPFTTPMACVRGRLGARQGLLQPTATPKARSRSASVTSRTGRATAVVASAPALNTTTASGPSFIFFGNLAYAFGMCGTCSVTTDGRFKASCRVRPAKSGLGVAERPTVDVGRCRRTVLQFGLGIGVVVASVTRPAGVHQVLGAVSAGPLAVTGAHRPVAAR